MPSDDFNRVIARFPITSTIEAALRLYPDKSVIVFCRCRHVRDIIDWLVTDYNVSGITWRSMTVHLDDGRIVIFMNEYRKSWGYDCNKFVVVNYL